MLPEWAADWRARWRRSLLAAEGAPLVLMHVASLQVRVRA